MDKLAIIVAVASERLPALKIASAICVVAIGALLAYRQLCLKQNH